VSVSLLSDRVAYTPFVCNAAEAEADGEACAGAWFANATEESSFPSVTTVQKETWGVIPQMFFQFRATTAYLTLMANRNASVDLTLSSANGLSITRTIPHSISSVAAVNLVEGEVTLLTLTVVPAGGPASFGVSSLEITVHDDLPSSSIFPTPALPPPTPISTFVPATSTAWAASTITMPAAPPDESRKKLIAHAVGITLGVGLGLTLVLAVLFYLYRKRRRRRAEADAQLTWTRPAPAALAGGTVAMGAAQRR